MCLLCILPALLIQGCGSGDEKRQEPEGGAGQETMDESSGGAGEHREEAPGLGHPDLGGGRRV